MLRRRILVHRERIIMGYNDLSESTLTADERRAEANRILEIIGDQMVKEMHAHEAKFIRQMENPNTPVSTKQIFWLRDLAEKYNT
jgi:hypothetical protein